MKAVTQQGHVIIEPLTALCSNDPQVHPDDVFYECNGAGDCGTPAHYVPGQQWGLNKVGAPQAWKYTTGSSKVKVCHPPALKPMLSGFFCSVFCNEVSRVSVVISELTPPSLYKPVVLSYANIHSKSYMSGASL